MAQNVRYSAAERREIEARRVVEFEARMARWASLTFDEFLAEEGSAGAAAFVVEAKREWHGNLRARYGFA